MAALEMAIPKLTYHLTLKDPIQTPYASQSNKNLLCPSTKVMHSCVMLCLKVGARFLLSVPYMNTLWQKMTWTATTQTLTFESCIKCFLIIIPILIIIHTGRWHHWWRGRRRSPFSQSECQIIAKWRRWFKWSRDRYWGCHTEWKEVGGGGGEWTPG